MSSRRPSLVAATLAVGLLLAACAGDDATDDAGDAGDDLVAGEVTADLSDAVEAPTELPEPAPGPAPELEVAAESAESPLPEVAVRKLNGEGGWVQFKNELPSEQPLLVWFWAPF